MQDNTTIACNKPYLNQWCFSKESLFILRSKIYAFFFQMCTKGKGKAFMAKYTDWSIFQTLIKFCMHSEIIKQYLSQYHKMIYTSEYTVYEKIANYVYKGIK